MELLESTDPQKKKLLEASAYHKKELNKEIKSITSSAEKALTNVLLIGGAAVVSYLLVSQIAGSKKKNKKTEKKKSKHIGEDEEINETHHESSFFSHVGEIILTQATMVLLELAKEKLAAYLESRKSNDENS